MYRGLGALNMCDPETGVCSTDQPGYVSPPIQNPVDTSGLWQNTVICNGSFLASLIPACTPPTPSQVAKDTTNYGGQLSPAAQAEATSMAQNIVAIDPNLQPEINWNNVGWMLGLGIAAFILIEKL